MTDMTQNSGQVLTLAIPRDRAEVQLREELAKWSRLRGATPTTRDGMVPLDKLLSKAKKFTRDVLLKMFTTDRGANQVGMLGGKSRTGSESVDELLRTHQRVCDSVIVPLESLIERLPLFEEQLATQSSGHWLQALTRLLVRFPLVARQLRDRRGSRPTLEINDEYDVQNLVHSLLRIHFDDIRPEEWTPNYAGRASRMDFLLKREHAVIEVKMTRQGLKDKELGDQLIIDIAHYEKHPDCRSLICFVYDPDHKIGNPVGLRADLEAKSTESLKITVIIA